MGRMPWAQQAGSRPARGLQTRLPLQSPPDRSRNGRGIWFPHYIHRTIPSCHRYWDRKQWMLHPDRSRRDSVLCKCHRRFHESDSSKPHTNHISMCTPLATSSLLDDMHRCHLQRYPCTTRHALSWLALGVSILARDRHWSKQRLGRGSLVGRLHWHHVSNLLTNRACCPLCVCVCMYVCARVCMRARAYVRMCVCVRLNRQSRGPGSWTHRRCHRRVRLQ